MSSSFLVVFLDFSVYSIMSSASSDSLLLPFQFGILFFLFLLGLLWLGLPKLCWIKLSRVDIFVSFLILEEMLSPFHHYAVGCRFDMHGLYCVEVCSLCDLFLKSFFNHKVVLSFVKRFLQLLRWSYGLNSSIFDVVYHTAQAAVTGVP